MFGGGNLAATEYDVEAMMVPDVLELIHAGRRNVRTVVGTSVIWEDEGRLGAAWQRWMGRRPKGSVTALSAKPIRPSKPIKTASAARHPEEPPDESVLFASDAQLPRRLPAVETRGRSVSSVTRVRPDKWRVETGETESQERFVLVIAGSQWWTGIRSLDGGQMERIGEVPVGMPGLHAAIAEMLEGDRILTELDLRVAGDVVHAGRRCVRLLGVPTDSQQLLIWPASSYDLYLDREFGVFLRFAAALDHEILACAEFSTITFNSKVSEESFALPSTVGIEWRTLSPAI